MGDNDGYNYSRRKYIGSTGTALLLANIGSASAQENRTNPAVPKGPPYDISITNNSKNKHKLTLTLTKIGKSEPSYQKQVVLPGLNDPNREEAQSVNKRAKVKVPHSQLYEARIEDENGNSAQLDWYIPAEGTEFISLSASVSPEGELDIFQSIV